MTTSREYDAKDKGIARAVDEDDLDNVIAAEGIPGPAARKQYCRLVILRDTLIRLAAGIPSASRSCGSSSMDWLRAERRQMHREQSTQLTGCRRIHGSHLAQQSLQPH
ncbi:MAG: hypothetical protein P4L33_13015 [Capsulimonadaceae bacterium]|nr:hypothetical protein [Capsulimonadaceae bacterium]